MPFLPRKITLFLITAALFVPPSFAVSNVVRREDFKWMTVQTEHFDIYYDKSTEQMVPRMAHYLEKAWSEVGEMYGFFVPERTPFFFYSDHNEFEQTNIVFIGEGTGGVTEAFKNRLLIFNDGSEEWLRHVIYHEFTHVVQFNILYGGFWKSVRLLKSPFYPLWMMEGTAEHGSGSIDDATGDMVVRDAFYHHQLPPLAELQGFAHLKPNQVTLGYKTGDMAIEFMRDEYGEERLHDFMFAMKDYFDVSSALQGMLGLDLDRFNKRFLEWLDEKYTDLFNVAKTAAYYGTKLTKSDKIPQFNEAPVISPDGKTIYYFSDKGGPYQLYSLSLDTNKAGPIIPLKYFKYENLETRGRALSISPDGRWLAFSGEKLQDDFLYLYDLKKKKLKKIKVPFDELRSPSFSPVDNDRIVCVGMMRGYDDLYIINQQGQIIERLTNTPQDEKDPVFSRDGKLVYYSGEVMLPDLSESDGRNIFSLDVATKQTIQLTSDPGSELQPEPLPDGSLIFTRDRDNNKVYGFNFYRLDANGNETRLTNLIGGAFSPRYSVANKTIYYVGFDGGEKHIYKSTWTFEADTAEIPAGFGEARIANAPSILNWPTDNHSPLFTNVGRPYRFKASTDLFIPFFFYSSVDGFVLMDVWQFSDMLGNHQFQEQAQYGSSGDVMDITVLYTYARFRPNFTIGVRSLRFYRDFDQTSQRRELTGFGVMDYPLDRVSSIALGAGTTDRKDSFLNGPMDEEELDDERNRFHDRFVIGTLSYDTITGRYLVPTKGQRLSFTFQQGFNTVGGNQNYQTGLIQASVYSPIPRESTIASRLIMARSTGEEAQEFRLGGIDRIRGVSSGSAANKKNNMVLGSMEARMRIKYLNARTGFLFPDFFFKAAYLVAFVDAGTGWNTGIEREQSKWSQLDTSAGGGISWPTFILQSFQLNLTVQWAHNNRNGANVWYISAGPSF